MTVQQKTYLQTGDKTFVVFFIKMELGPLLHEIKLSPHYKALTMYDFNVLAEKWCL